MLTSLNDALNVVAQQADLPQQSPHLVLSLSQSLLPILLLLRFQLPLLHPHPNLRHPPHNRPTEQSLWRLMLMVLGTYRKQRSPIAERLDSVDIAARKVTRYKPVL